MLDFVRPPSDRFVVDCPLGFVDNQSPHRYISCRHNVPRLCQKCHSSWCQRCRPSCIDLVVYFGSASTSSRQDEDCQFHQASTPSGFGNDHHQSHQANCQFRQECCFVCCRFHHVCCQFHQACCLSHHLVRLMGHVLDCLCMGNVEYVLLAWVVPFHPPISSLWGIKFVLYFLFALLFGWNACLGSRFVSLETYNGD